MRRLCLLRNTRLRVVSVSTVPAIGAPLQRAYSSSPNTIVETTHHPSRPKQQANSPRPSDLEQDVRASVTKIQNRYTDDLERASTHSFLDTVLNSYTDAGPDFWSIAKGLEHEEAVDRHHYNTKSAQNWNRMDRERWHCAVAMLDKADRHHGTKILHLSNLVKIYEALVRVAPPAELYAAKFTLEGAKANLLLHRKLMPIMQQENFSFVLGCVLSKSPYKQLRGLSERFYTMGHALDLNIRTLYKIGSSSSAAHPALVQFESSKARLYARTSRLIENVQQVFLTVKWDRDLPPGSNLAETHRHFRRYQKQTRRLLVSLSSFNQAHHAIMIRRKKHANNYHAAFDALHHHIKDYQRASNDLAVTTNNCHRFVYNKSKSVRLEHALAEFKERVLWFCDGTYEMTQDYYRKALPALLRRLDTTPPTAMVGQADVTRRYWSKWWKRLKKNEKREFRIAKIIKLATYDRDTVLYYGNKPLRRATKWKPKYKGKEGKNKSLKSKGVEALKKPTPKKTESLKSVST